MRQFAYLVERYTDIRDVSSELLHTLIDRIVVHKKEMEGDEMIMRVDVYYRFIGYVGDKTGDDMKAPQIRHRRWEKRMNWSMKKVKTRKTSDFPGKAGSLVCNEYITPVIIKYPFWQMTNDNPKAVYCCLN